MNELEKSEYTRQKKAGYRLRNRQYIRDYLSDKPCRACGYNGIARQFHHRGDDEKTDAISRLVSIGASIRMIDDELAKCDVLCCNCHQELHHAERSE
jgi:hypothetical protein